MTTEPGVPDETAVDPWPGEETQEIVVVTGLSGGGKTAAAKLFEDLGYVVVDNLPGELLRELADLVASDRSRFARTAIVIDIRAGDVPVTFGAMRGALEGRGIRPVIMFLEARDDVLIRRFSETRHRHPLADERGIAASIELERELLEPVRAEADVVLDTSDLSLRELRELIFARLADVQSSDRLAIQLLSFGFKHGVPLEADLLLDVRFMHNPFYIETLRPNPASPTPSGTTCWASRSPGSSWSGSGTCWTCSCPPMSRRARTGSPSPSAAPAATTAPSSWSRSWRTGSGNGTSGRSRCSTGSWNGEPPPLADRRHRRQAVAPPLVRRPADPRPGGRSRPAPADGRAAAGRRRPSWSWTR